MEVETLKSLVHVISQFCPEGCHVTGFEDWEPADHKKQMIKLGKFLRSYFEYDLIKKCSPILDEKQTMLMKSRVSDVDMHQRLLPSEKALLVVRCYGDSDTGGVLNSRYASYEARNCTVKIKESMKLLGEDYVMRNGGEILDPEKSFDDYSIINGEIVTYVCVYIKVPV
jgi:hypothetical protein